MRCLRRDDFSRRERNFEEWRQAASALHFETITDMLVSLSMDELLTAKEIGKKLGFEVNLVQKLLRILEVPANKVERKFEASFGEYGATNTRELLKKMLSSGMGINAIGRKFGLHKTTIAERVRKFGLKAPGRGGCNNPHGYGGKSRKRPPGYHEAVREALTAA